jgi:hypothetical protein
MTRYACVLHEKHANAVDLHGAGSSLKTMLVQGSTRPVPLQTGVLLERKAVLGWLRTSS